MIPPVLTTSMERDAILKEIRRAAAENGGIAPGQNQFEKLTGITQGKWRGRLWLKWSDAVYEAGLTPGRMQEAHPEEFLLESLANLTRICGHFPTASEIKMQRVRDRAFPNHGVFDRLGSKSNRIEKLRLFVGQHAQYADIADLLPYAEPLKSEESDIAERAELTTIGDGYVYMLKLGKHYKIGKTFAVPRRHRQIALELPEKPDVIHSIQTDDPEGIEAYWHKRFAQKRTNGEWFALDREDIKNFKRRKFM